MDGGGVNYRSSHRRWYFFDSGRNGKIRRFTVLAFSNLAVDRGNDFERGVVLRRIGFTVSKFGRELRLSQRNLRQALGVSLRLDGFVGA